MNIPAIATQIRARLNAAGLHTSVAFGEEITAIITQALSENIALPKEPGETPEEEASPAPSPTPEQAPPAPADHTRTRRGRKERTKPLLPLPKDGRVPFGILKVKAG